MQPKTRYRKEKLCSEDNLSQGSRKPLAEQKVGSRTKCVACILLIVGIVLCLIAGGIYLVLWLNSQSNTAEADNERDINFGMGLEDLEDLHGHFNFTLQAFEKFADGLEEPQTKRPGCHELSCRIVCSDNLDLYADATEAMIASNCEVITVLVVANQHQHSLEDKWIKSNSEVLKIVVTNSEFDKLKSGAFSVTMFAKVFHMTWVDLTLTEMSNGALLGLYSLRKLEIESQLPNISMTFLQPVQVTLTHLRLNSGICFKSNLNVFENIYLEKLMHLDLSRNSFVGPLSKRIFTGTPNVSYLYLKYCGITSIEDTAFEDLAEKLILVDLKHNLLTQISVDVLRISGTRLLLDLEPNNWNCNCELQSMVDYYNNNKNLFITVPYCRLPFSLYGKIFDELKDQELSCDQVTDGPNKFTSQSITKVTADGREEVSESPTGNSFSNHDATDDPTFTNGAILQFSCSEAINYDTTTRQFVERDVSEEETMGFNSGTFVFEPPVYDLVLDLLENYSVRASIEGYERSDQLNIIWFSDELQSDTVIRNASQTDYVCMQYEEPYLIVDPLQQNHTYTFCMMPMDNLVISPLLCQPLHVPMARDNGDSDDIWIAESEKQFTIAMLCLIFFISTIFGAIFGYLGIKSFPNLLEGSKNVLVVKELDKACYVSTITDSQYTKTPQSKMSFRNANMKSSDSFSTIYESNLPSLINLRPPSHCFEEPLSTTNLQTIGYEMPKQFKNIPTESCTMDKCLDRPNSPPPLPKRNSNVSEYIYAKPKALKDP